MRGKIEDVTKDYALIKLPDGRTVNVKLSNIAENVEKGHEIDLKANFPSSME